MTLDQRSPSSPPPKFYVNVSAQDFRVYPIVGKLLTRWESENRNGTFAGFSEPYDYGEGLAIVRALGDRVPGAYWLPGSVVIAYKGFFFDLTAFAPPHAD